MVFKKIATLVLGLLLTSSCTPPYEDPSQKDENIIGKKVEAVTDIQYSNSGSLGTLAVFDEVIRKIHHFDLENMKHLRSMEVQNPAQDHYLLHDSEGQYTVDLTKKHLSIYRQDGGIQHDPVKFLGEPVSSSFRPENGYLILYDDLQNVSIVELSQQGFVTRSRVMGPILSADESIQSGDIAGDHLVLAMSDGTLRRVDLGETLDSGDWVFETFTTTLSDISWVAPIPSSSNQVLIRSQQSIAVYDFTLSAIASEITTSKVFKVHKYSKSQDPHLVVSEWDTGGLTVKEKTAYWRSGNEENLNLVYLDGSDIRTRSLPRGESPLMLSHLDLATNTWAVIRSASTKYTSYNSLNSVRDGRRLSKVAFSHGGALAEDVLPDNTILKLSKDYVFALFPSELGYAQRIHIDSGEVKELKLFNLRQIKK